MCGKPTDITSLGTNCTCECAENPQTSPHRAQTVPLAVRKIHRPSQRVQAVPVHVRKIMTSPHRAQTVPVGVWKTDSHHHAGHKLYLRMCGKPTDVASLGTNCTCGCAENPKTSPHRAQTVTLAVRKTHRPITKSTNCTCEGAETPGHHPTDGKLYLWMCGKTTDITTQSTNCNSGCAENPQAHHKEYKLYLCMCGNLGHHHKGHKLYLLRCGNSRASLHKHKLYLWIAENSDITTHDTNCTCEGAETPGHHHTEDKLYLWMCGKPTDITTQRIHVDVGAP